MRKQKSMIETVVQTASDTLANMGQNRMAEHGQQVAENNDLLDDLHSDHGELKSMLEALLKSRNAERRTTIFKDFRTLLFSHSHAEATVLYKRLEKHPKSRPAGLEGDVEHEVAEGLLNQLGRSRTKAADTWTARCTVLKELLEHHIEEEEGKIFSQTRKLFSAAERRKLGAQFRSLKDRLAAEASH